MSLELRMVKNVAVCLAICLATDIVFGVNMDAAFKVIGGTIVGWHLREGLTQRIL